MHHHDRNTQSPGVVSLPPTFYDLMVRTFVMRGHEKRFREMTADLAKIMPGDAVLDVGCGTGTMAVTAKRRVGDAGRVVGIDPSPQLLAGARRKAARAGLTIEFREASIDRLDDLADNSFDVAMGTFMMHHLPNDVTRKGLAELHRVLKPQGRLLIIDFVRTDDGTGKFGEGTIGVTELAPLLETGGFTRREQGQMPIRIRSVARSHTEYGYVFAVANPGAGEAGSDAGQHAQGSQDGRAGGSP